LSKNAARILQQTRRRKEGEGEIKEAKKTLRTTTTIPAAWDLARRG